MSRFGVKKKLLRKEVDFEFNPPRCINCNNYKPPQYGVPGKKFYRPAHCIANDFEVKPHSICNAWVGQAGEILEGAPT